jgi:DNA repair protein RecN (Recombination protein N)
VLLELRVQQIGVIEDVTLVFDGGVTALTGETGAGKTLIVDAIELLTGATADATLVRPGAKEAVVEGRFAGPGGDDVILTRVIPARGRSRCYADGRMVSAAQLAETGATLVDLHGQHAHQSLLSPAHQRSALDRAGQVDTTEMTHWRKVVRELQEAQSELGGDARARARQLDLLGYQLAEIESANLEDPDEDEALRAEEELLADATGLAESATSIWQGLSGDDGVSERLGMLSGLVAGRRPLAAIYDRLMAAQEELADLAAEARTLAETVEADPERLTAIGERRHVLTELRRKYGGTLAEVIAYREDLRVQVEDLQSHDQRAAALEAELERAHKELAAATERVWAARRAAAPTFTKAVENELQALAMARARFEVEVGPDPAREQVTWLLGANPGEPLLPLAKVASGGELARAMLAARLVSGRSGPDDGPATLVFDEVDAGIGGEAAVAVGRALCALAPGHLAQVAAFADHQVAVSKNVEGERTVARARPLNGDERIVELARMLSGRPDSAAARRHAEELLSEAAAYRRKS